MALPGGTFPLETKVVSLPHYRVDADGEIHGRGHPRRDAIEWVIPVLWPVKVITLPMRGPRPALKGETRIALRLLDDVYIPAAAAVTSKSLLSLPGPPDTKSSSAEGVFLRLRYGGARASAVDAALPLADFEPAVMQAEIAAAHQSVERQRRPPKLTLLFLKDSRVFVVSDYWVEAGQLLTVGSDGRRICPCSSSLTRLRSLPLLSKSLPRTSPVSRKNTYPATFRTVLRLIEGSSLSLPTSSAAIWPCRLTSSQGVQCRLLGSPSPEILV